MFWSLRLPRTDPEITYTWCGSIIYPRSNSICEYHWENWSYLRYSPVFMNTQHREKSYVDQDFICERASINVKTFLFWEKMGLVGFETAIFHLKRRRYWRPPKLPLEILDDIPLCYLTQSLRTWLPNRWEKEKKNVCILEYPTCWNKDVGTDHLDHTYCRYWR